MEYPNDITKLGPKVLTSALEAAKCGVLVTNPNLPDNPIIYVNPTFCEMTGFSADEIIGKNCRFLQGDDRDQPGLTPMRNAIRQRQSCTVTLRNYRKNGELFYNELTISPIMSKTKKLYRFIGVQKDVTTDIEIKRQRAHMVATLMHDVKTPLLATIRVIDYLLTSQAQPRERQKLLNSIADSERALLRLVDNAIDSYRSEDAPLSFEAVYFPIFPQLKICADQFKSTIERKRLSLVVKPTNAQLCGDKRLFTRAFLNLIDVAITYSQDEERILIETIQHPSSIEIKTNCYGSRLPDKFLKGDLQLLLSADDENGTELALFLSKKIFQAHNGELTISREKQVTTFFAVFRKV